VKKQALGTACVALAAGSWGTWALFLRGHGLPRASLLTAAMGASSALFYGANTLVTKKLFDQFTSSELLSYRCFSEPLGVAGAMGGLLIVGAGAIVAIGPAQVSES